MVVEIKEDVFNGSDFKGLNYLIQILTYKQRYALFVEYTLIRDTELYNKLDEDDKKEIEENFNRIMTEGLDSTHFISENSSFNLFNIEEAIRFFNQPISIILENSLNDQYFIIAIINHFDSLGEVKRHLDNGWIQFENAGSCTNVENFITGKLQSFNNFSFSYGKNNSQYLRCFVLLDSDKEYPTMASKPAYEKLSPFLSINRISNHILEKREMENYMPEEVFDDIATNPDLRKWVNAYAYLSDQQKNHLDIYEGFPKKVAAHLSKKKKKKQRKRKTQHNHIFRTIRTELDINIQNLYGNVSKINFEILDKGFKLSDFKTEFPKHFEKHPLIHKKSLSKRAGSNELQDILDKITILL